MKNPTDNNDTRAGRYQRLMSLFDALCEQTYQEQRAALQQVGLTDTKMAAELRSMLAEDAGALAPQPWPEPDASTARLGRQIAWATLLFSLGLMAAMAVWLGTRTGSTPSVAREIESSRTIRPSDTQPAAALRTPIAPAHVVRLSATTEATVWAGGARLGATPLDVVVMGTRDITLRQQGFTPADVRLTRTMTEHVVTLVPRVR